VSDGDCDRRTIEIVDTTMRDGNQSLWGATGLTTPDVLAIAPTVDRVGFRACDFTSSTHMAVSVRFHREDPWERLRLAAAAMPSTPLSMITTGKRFISWRAAAEDVLELVFRTSVRNGLRRVQIADPMNDPADLAQMAAIAKRAGVEEVVIGLTYSVSPVHTDAFYAERATAMAACADVDRLYLKDPGGLVSAERLHDLAPLFVEAFAPRPVELHSHGTIGLPQPMYMEGAALGFGTLHTRSGRCRTARRTRRARRRCATSRRPASRTRSTSRRWQRCPSTSARSRSTSACRSAAHRPSTTPPTTTTRCRAAW